MEQLTKADLFNGAWPAPVAAEVPDLKKQVFVRILTVAEVEAISSRMASEGETPGLVGTVVALCACDSAGNRIFVDDDAAEIGRRPMTHVYPIFEAGRDANRLTAEAQEKARKNSSPAPA